MEADTDSELETPGSAFHNEMFIHSPKISALLVIVFTVVTFLGVVGNVVLLSRALKDPPGNRPRVFIVSLAIVDLMFAVVCVQPTLLSNIFISWQLGSALCSGSHYFRHVYAGVSALLLVAISADLFLAVKVKRRIGKVKSILIVLGIWAFSLVICLPRRFFHQLQVLELEDPEMFFCLETWPSKYKEHFYFFTINLGLLYLLPLIASVTMALLTLTHIKGGNYNIVKHMEVQHTQRNPAKMEEAEAETENETQGEVETEPINSRSKSRKIERSMHHENATKNLRINVQVVKLLLQILLSFFFLWLPIQLIFTAAKLQEVQPPPTANGMRIFAMAQYFAVFNCCVRPIFFRFFPETYLEL